MLHFKSSGVMQMSKEKWLKPRHKIITAIARFILTPYVKLKYNINIRRFKEQGNRQYLILLNHQTPLDQFFVAISFKGVVYYLATEDIFSLGFVSDLLRWAVAPIPIKKQTVDIPAIRSCLQVVKEGGSLCIAPEGNRTYSGKTEYMNFSIVSLVKKLKLPVALYRIEGGYGVEPRWSDVARKGRMKAYVSRVIEPEEYEKMTADELFEAISQGLYVNEAVADGDYIHPKRAEYLERAIYVCPFCGLSRHESHDHKITCQGCGRAVIYNTDKTLSGEGFDFPFKFVNDWYEYQKEFVRNLNLDDYISAPLFTDRANLDRVIVRKKKVPIKENAGISLYGDRIVFDEGSNDEMLLPFDEISVVTVLGRNKLNIYHKEDVYQLKGSKRFNALKYVNIFYHYRNVQKGDPHGEFLGL